MAHSQYTTVEQTLAALFSTDWIVAQARSLGVVQRLRKIHPAALFWTLVLGFGTGAHRSLEGLRRAFCQAVGLAVTRSAFYDRFTPELVVLLQAAVTLASQALLGSHMEMSPSLSCLRDVVIADGTVLQLYTLLKARFPAYQAGQAAAKLHLVISVFGQTPTKIKLTGQRPNEGKLLAIGPWVAGRLLLIDLGFFGYRLFDRIDRNHGFFIRRLKDSINPRITQVHQAWRGRAKPLVGQTLQAVLAGLHRHVLDVHVQVTVTKRLYRGRCRKARRTFRLVGLRHPDTGVHHLYMTNIPSGLLTARQIAALYTARWLVELLFDQLKTHYRLADLPSGQPAIVQTLISASLLTWLADQAVTHSLHEQVVTASRRQAAIMAAFSAHILDAMILQLGLYQGTHSLTRFIQRELHNPNHKQRPLLQRAGVT